LKLDLTRDAGEFAARTRELFESRFDYNLIATVLAGVLAGRYPHTVPLFAYGAVGSDLRFAALRTPPWDMLATEIDSEDARAFVRRWLAEDPSLPGVGGPVHAARAIAAAWAEQTGGQARCRVRELGYVLERVTDPPRPAPGSLRPVRADERPLALQWMRDFARETGALPEDRAEVIVDARAADRGLWMWEHGEPVTLLGTAPPVAGVVRIGPVYTPPQNRRHGYAGTAVAAASRQALDQGARRCLLYTDATNPTSNKIYIEVGFRRYGEHEEWTFESAPAGAG
jgi:RimJ/RimL family protein N-acetyltransferase